MKQIQDFEYQEYVKMKEHKEHMIKEDYNKDKNSNVWMGIFVSYIFSIIFGFGTFIIMYLSSFSFIGSVIISYMGAGLGFYVGQIIGILGKYKLQEKYQSNRTEKGK